MKRPEMAVIKWKDKRLLFVFCARLLKKREFKHFSILAPLIGKCYEFLHDVDMYF